MKDKIKSLIDKLAKTHTLTLDEYEYLINEKDAESIEYAQKLALGARKAVYGNAVYISN